MGLQFCHIQTYQKAPPIVRNTNISQKSQKSTKMNKNHIIGVSNWKRLKVCEKVSENITRILEPPQQY